MPDVWKMKLEDIAPHIDGEYDLPPMFLDTVTIGEWQEIKNTSGIRWPEAWDALIHGDAAFHAALATVMLRRRGKEVPLPILLALTPDKISFRAPSRQEDEAPEADPTMTPPSTDESSGGPSPTSSGSSEETPPPSGDPT